MKMPEGWRRRYKEPGTVINGRDVEEAFNLCKLHMELNSSLLLMREMAEALEYYARDPHIEEGIMCDASPERAIKLLKKFKEWK